MRNFLLFFTNGCNIRKYVVKYMLYEYVISRGGNAMQIVQFDVGDTLEMKKKHPCGAFAFTVLRVGSDIRIRCNGCGRDVTVPREKLEKNIKKVTKTKGN